MTQYLENYKKNIVIDMRKKGYSYSEIQNAIHIPKSTVAFWLKDIKLTESQTEKLKDKQIKTAKANSEKRRTKTLEMIEEIKGSSAKDIKNISKRELWLMGVMLYWKERLVLNNENDLKKGVNFTSSDPYLIKLFLKWLKEVGNIEDEEVTPDIFIIRNKNINTDEIIAYWSDVTEFPEGKFTHIYYKNKQPINKKIIKSKTILSDNKRDDKKYKFIRSEFGLLRIRVKASSMLVRQISGWMNGVRSALFK